MEDLLKYTSIINTYFEEINVAKEPKNLYEPINYILQLGGKRIRPLLTILATDMFSGNLKAALPAATAIEVFHNFTLIHDDVMDNAPLRRGNATVHEKWDLNTAILSGDAMLIKALQFYQSYEKEMYKELSVNFLKTALEVCEGQQYDVDFETQETVSEQQYLKMIEYKTAVLLGLALQTGAIIANASKEDVESMYNIGINLGLAFQIQDDYLDTFGNANTFGKQIGGDIIENKKTYLFIKALELAAPEDKIKLLHLYNSVTEDVHLKIEWVKNIFIKSNANKFTLVAIKNFTNMALDKIVTLNIDENKKSILKEFALNLMQRNI